MTDRMKHGVDRIAPVGASFFVPAPEPEQRTLRKVHALLTAPGAPFEMETVSVRGVSMRTWKHVPATLRDVFEASAVFAAREFMVFESERATYGDFHRAVAALAKEFIRAGVVKGDRVTLAIPNRPEWPVVFFAAVSIGAIIAPLNPALSAPELRHAISDCGAKVVVIDDERFRVLRGLLDTDRERVYVSRLANTKLGVTRLEDVLGATPEWKNLPSGELPDCDLEPDDDATLFYTSGTTGQPKGVIGSHRNTISMIRVGAIAQARAALLSGRDYREADLPSTRPSCQLMIGSLSHVSPCCAIMTPAVLRGGKLVFMRRFIPDLAMQLIQDEKVHVAGGPPTVAKQLLEHPRGDYDLSSLRYVQYGGAPAASDLSRQVTETFSGSTPIGGYGMTETAATFCSHTGAECIERPESCGPPAPIGDIKIMDLDGKSELPIGAVGEVWMKGPQNARGYWDKPEESAKVFFQGWVRSGDIGRLDADGYLYIVDRAKDVIIRGGENIYSGEVENVLSTHPAVAEAAVVGMPHPLAGEEPVAVIRLQEGAETTELALRTFVRARLAGFKTPARIFFTSEALPRNDNGKLSKLAIKAWIRSGRQAREAQSTFHLV